MEQNHMEIISPQRWGSVASGLVEQTATWEEGRVVWTREPT